MMSSAEKFASQGEGNHMQEHLILESPHSLQQTEELKQLVAKNIDRPSLRDMLTDAIQSVDVEDVRRFPAKK